MATITQLMQSRVPGEIRIRIKGWDDRSYFIPQFKDVTGNWHGTDSHGHYLWFMDDYSTDWELYIEPKKVVARYQWAYRRGTSSFNLTDRYFTSEQELRNYISGVTWCQRLDYTKIEVEEGV